MPVWIRQAAAIPVRDGKIGMVTSRSGRRWVLPKGQIEPNQTPPEAALMEAWEEAGFVGVIEPDPCGAYCYEKFGREYHVLVYRLSVTEERVDWPEKPARHREWLPIHEVLERVEEPGLRELLRHVFGLIPRDLATDDWFEAASA